MPRKARAAAAEDEASRNQKAGRTLLYEHPLFRPLMDGASFNAAEFPKDVYALVSSGGGITYNSKIKLTPEMWAYAFGHCLLHLGFRHHDKVPEHSREWNAACCAVVDRLMKEVKVGRLPPEMEALEDNGKTEEKLYEMFCRQGLPDSVRFGTAGGALDLDDKRTVRSSYYYSGSFTSADWEEALSRGLTDAVTNAVEVAAGARSSLTSTEKLISKAERARRWFINSYPLLGAMASAFTLIEDAAICNREQISVAAINAETKEIYVNPSVNLTEMQTRFVMAHEFLHVGLRHHLRCQGRDAYLWNVACDYVINGWLVQMKVGEPPPAALFDQELNGLNAETVYDRIVTDLRRNRKLQTLRGNHPEGDMISKQPPAWWDSTSGITLDEFYRRCLAQGLAYHENAGRGWLPGNLVEEIRALNQPPISWDVELAQWFDHHFPPLEVRRSYARQSRRQSASPDIPRARYVKDLPGDSRTFGVVLDTSGSMDRTLLAKALGAIASYSIARDVPYARVVFCDASAYDKGYMAPEEIAGRVEVRGRGGTVLQPGVTLLEKAKDFPEDGPILIITDAQCDEVRVRRSHAFLIPAGAHLPFHVSGDIFRIK